MILRTRVRKSKPWVFETIGKHQFRYCDSLWPLFIYFSYNMEYKNWSRSIVSHESHVLKVKSFPKNYQTDTEYVIMGRWNYNEIDIIIRRVAPLKFCTHWLVYAHLLVSRAWKFVHWKLTKQKCALMYALENLRFFINIHPYANLLAVLE